MDGPVVAAIISSSVAVFVAVVSAVRADLHRAGDRRYERRRMFLIDAQDAALVLRDALREYGVTLRATADDLTPALHERARHLKLAAAAAGGRMDVARARVDDGAVGAALAQWEQVARDNLISVANEELPSEDVAFAELNRVVGRALRSPTGRERR